MQILIILCIALSVTMTAGCMKKITTPLPGKQNTEQVITEPEQKTAQSQPAVVKEAHLDANWYTKNPQDLSQEIDDYLEMAIKKYYVEADSEQVKALVVPHAGLYYSGLCAATAYQTLLSSKNLLSNDIRNTKINHVVILAPDHSGLSFGINLPTYTEYKTALGSIPVNTTAIEQLKSLKFVQLSEKTHNTEHALEMQLPWLQKTIQTFSITPLIVGNIDEYDVKQLASELKKIITETTLVIVTTDFTHHGEAYNYKIFDEQITEYLRALDSSFIENILTPNSKNFTELISRTQATICGQNPLKILLALLEEKHLGTIEEGRLCSYYTSAHLSSARDKSGSINHSSLITDLPDEDATNSVSYAAIVFSNQNLAALSKENRLTSFEKISLTHVARESIANELSEGKRTPPPLLWPVTTPALNRPQGAFVTLYDKEDKLRGCIGRITSLKPLYQTTQDMAISAAFKDERFAPLNLEDLASTKIGITILSQPERVFALSNIAIGKHGIILNKFKPDGTLSASSVFLPQVPVSMKWDLATTLAELSKKAGLDAAGWQDNCELQTFEGYEVKEEA